MFKIAYCAGHHLANPKGIPAYLGLGDVREWTLNDRVARYFAQAAEEFEDVALLRTDDPTGENFIDIPDRVAEANRWGADVYIDMHHNGGIGGGEGGGAVAFSYPGSKKGAEYRDAIYEALMEAGGIRGDRSAGRIERNFQTLRLTQMPAVLMEYGFMDSKTDAPIILTEEHARLAAFATMEGIARVAGLTRKPKRVYRVQVGAFTSRENAEEMKKKLEAAGFSSFITQ